MDTSVYTRPQKPKTMHVTKRRGAPLLAPPCVPDIIELDRTTECHVTPPDVARRMVGYLGAPGNFLTLEPQAGTGNLIAALYAAGYSRFELVAIERHTLLCNALRKRFKNEYCIDLINECFLGYAERAAGKIEYPRIIMNPPFKKVKQHMNAALTLLGGGGHDLATLVALVPVTYEHKDAQTLEVLPPNTFDTASVHTKIIRFEVQASV